MNENNQQEPNIDELIKQGEKLSVNKDNTKSFFKKPTVITGIILLIVILIVIIFIPRADRIVDDNKTAQPLRSENKLEILERLSKENSTNSTKEEKLNILENLSQSQENTTTREEKLKILNSLSK